MNDVTLLLSEIENGDPQAADKLLPLVYEELRTLAAAKLAQEKPGQTLQATALVHEAYLRLLGPAGQSIPWANRGHFFAAAAEAMRRILVDNARRKNSPRHGGGRQRCDLIDAELGIDTATDEFFELDQALTRFAAVNPRAAQLLHLRFFLDMSVEDAAAVLGIDARTARRDWAYARVWLRRELDRS